MYMKSPNLVVLCWYSPIVIRIVVSGLVSKSYPSILMTATIEAFFFGEETLKPKFTIADVEIFGKAKEEAESPREWS